MTDHQQVLTTKTNMGLQSHPCNKRPLEEQLVYQQTNGPRAAKQQCTIRVGLEAPDHLESTWTADYESYVNGFNAAEARASTPYSAPTTPTTTQPAYYASPADSADYNYGNTNSEGYYQNLTSMLPVGGESLADRFERVCSSPRPYVQYGRDDYYQAETPERYWNYNSNSNSPPKKVNTKGYYEMKSGYQMASQTIQRDENGKSYLELGAKAQPDWRPNWTPTPSVVQPVKSCSKCGNALSTQRSLLPPCYRHQRLSVLSLSMLKLNRYRQCSDPSLHRSVLICNTLRHIEDEMEREGLVCNPSTDSSNCDTCCCSNCGAVFTNNTKTPPESYSYELKPETTPDYSKPDEEDSGFGDEDSREIDWSSVFSMSSGFDGPSSDSYDSPTFNNGAQYEDFSNVRWKTEDELEGFVHILVGS